MPRKECPQSWFFEIALVLICLALCWMLYMIGAYRMVVLHLFYLPVVLAAFFLGRYRAGVLTLLCAVGAAVVVMVDVNTLVSYESPIVMWLALAVWSAVLGLVAILAGTLSDERTAKIAELHDAYVGVVEVLSRYLNSADSTTNDQAARVSQLSQKVAARMGLPNDEIDNIRVAALLQDINHIEVTAKVIQKAVGDLRHAGRPNMAAYTFNGSDLVCSLGNVLTGTWPLLLEHGLGQTVPEEGNLESGGAAHQRRHYSHGQALRDFGLLRAANRQRERGDRSAQGRSRGRPQPGRHASAGMARAAIGSCRTRRSGTGGFLSIGDI